MSSSELGHREDDRSLAPAGSLLRGATGRLGGAQGNERLTSAVALVLLVLLGTEVLTTLDLSSFLPVHLFLGLVLLPAISLKLASATWRAARYYAGSAEYRHRGPPQMGLRLLAPALVAATAVLFGSGVALVVTGSGGGVLGTLHVGSFVVWFVFIVAHVGAHLLRALDGGLADWRPRRRLPGVGWRTTLVLGALVAGIALALATHPVQSSWLSDHHHHHDDAGAQAFERR
jgi:hypothetical protein